MHELVAKLTALDPDAGAAVRVIARFDALVEGRAGLTPILAAVAVLTGSPARLTAPAYGVDLRIEPDGRVRHDVGATDPHWLSAPLENGGPPAFWLERGGAVSLIDAMVLDRAAFAARELLHRTRGRTPSPADDPAAVETVLDSGASRQDRLHAARLLRLPADGVFRAVARTGSAGRIEIVGKPGGLDHLRACPDRTGIGPAVAVAELPGSWAQAKTALAFAAEGTDQDPGPNVVFAEELGLLALLPAGLDPAGPTPPDVRALGVAAAEAPWVLTTLEAFTSHVSLRLAAAALFLHHSTLQSRIASIEQDLKWPIRDPRGRLRVQLALAARRYLLHPS